MSDSIKLYSAVYVALMALAISKVLLEMYLEYWTAVAAIAVVAVIKASLIAYYYQHLKDEPRAVTWVVMIGVGGVLLLGSAATYSIT